MTATEVNADILAAFSSDLLYSRKGKATKTVEAYVADVKQFLLWANKDFRGVEEHDILRYKRELIEERGLSKTSVNRKLSALRAFYLLAEKSAGNPMVDVENFRVPKSRKPKLFEADEAKKILRSLREDTPYRLRDKAIIYLFAFTGIRREGCMKLRLSDISGDCEAITVTEKGSKTRTIPVIEPAKSILRRYLQIRDNIVKDPSDAVFLSREGSSMSATSIWRVAKKTADKVNLKGHPHKWRHSFATTMVDNDVDIRTLQEILGHESMTSTEVYLHVSRKKVEQKMRAARPYN